MSVGTALKDLATQQLPEEKLAAEVATANRSIALHHSLLKDALKKIQAVHKDGQMYVEKGRQMATELARVADALGDGEGAQLTTQAERDGLRRLAALQSRVFDMLRDLNQVVHAAAAAPVEQTLLLSRGSRADVKRFEKLAATLEQCKRKQQQQQAAAASTTSRQQPLEAGEAVAGARNSLAEAGQQLSTLLGKVNGDMVAFGPRFFTAFYAAFARMLEEGRALAEAQAETNSEMLRAAGQKAPAGKAETAEQDADQQQQQQQATPGADADKRAEVLSQIIDAERRHVARLESIMKYRDHIVKELAEKRINLSQDELSAIFMNVDDVYAVHLATLPLLEQAFGAEPAVLSERVAAVVEQQMAATERAYMPFLEGTSLALGTLDRAMKHKSFSALIRLLAQQQGIFGKFTLEQLLALPARHIKKFDTLLKLFHENTPLSSKGWFVFHEMLEKFDAVVARLSRAKAQGDNMKKLIDVRDRIKDFEGDVAEVGRILLHDDSVSLAVHQPKPPVFGGQPPTPLQPGHGYYLFCFNDCLSLCTKLSSGLMSTGPDTYQHVARIPVTGMRVEELPESSDTIKNGFRVECTGGESFVFGAHSASAKITWVSRLRLATAEWKKTQVYGTDPEELMKRESEQEHYIPQIVEDAIAYIEKNGTETEGIFRLSCSARLIASLQLKVNTGKSIEYTDPLVAAVMLKQWLGSLPNPLLLRHLYNDWLDAGAKQSNSEAVAAFRALVAKLPRSNRLILNAICRLCQKIAAKRDANLMGTQALAIVIAPTILLPIDEASLLATNNARLNAFERLLLLYPDVFGEVATEEAAAKKEVAVFVEWKARQKRDRLEELRRSHHERQKTASLGMNAVSALEWMKKRRQELESQQQEKDEEVERAKASEREAELARQAREFEERMRKEKEEQEAIARKHREEEEEMRRAESDAKSKYEAAMLENQRRIEAERKRREEEAAAAAAAAAAKAAAEEAAAKAKEEETEEEEEEEDEDLPICAACNKPIRDDEDGLAALGKEWHETCFVCTECKGPLGKTIKQKDGKPFCGACFERLFLPKCASCGKAIAGAVVKALDQPWHPECFVCSRCGNPIAGGFSSGPDGKPVCSACNQ